MGIGDWGFGIGDWAQSPIPNNLINIQYKYNFLLKKIIKKINKKRLNIFFYKR